MAFLVVRTVKDKDLYQIPVCICSTKECAEKIVQEKTEKQEKINKLFEEEAQISKKYMDNIIKVYDSEESNELETLGSIKSKERTSEQQKRYKALQKKFREHRNRNIKGFTDMNKQLNPLFRKIIKVAADDKYMMCLHHYLYSYVEVPCVEK